MEGKKEIVAKLQECIKSDVDFSTIILDVKKLKTDFVSLVKEETDKLKKKYEEGNSEEEFRPPYDEFDAQFSDLMTTFNQKKKKWDDHRAQEMKSNLDKKQKVMTELETLIKEEHHIGQAFEKFNSLKEKWTSIGDVPASEYRDLQREYSHQIERFFYNINIYKSLKEYDLQKNLKLKKELISKVKELEKNDSIKELRELVNIYTQEWDEIGPTHQNQWEVVRDEFWEHVRITHKKIADYYKNQKEKIKENLLAKEALCQTLEDLSQQDLSDLKQWNSSQKLVNKIKDDWKKIGFAGKKSNDEVWQRFRKGMDAFYTHKREKQESLNETFKKNEERKLQLIQQAEELKESMEWKSSANVFKKLQSDWKRIGSAHPGREQKLWKKFRAPSDHFFERRKDYFDNRVDREKENLAKKKALIEQIKALDVKKEKKALETLEDWVKEWNIIGFVPNEEKNKVESEFHKIQNEKMKQLGLNPSEIEAQTFKLKLEGIRNASNSDQLLTNEIKHLHDKLKRIETDIKQYENNLGFFGGNTSNPLVKEVENKIERSKEEAQKIKERMDLIKK